MGEFVGETRYALKSMTEAIQDMKEGLREVVDKLESTSKEFRAALSPLSDFRRDILDLNKRVITLEADVKVLNEWRLTTKTQLATWGAAGGVAVGIVGWVVNKIWH